MSSPSPSRNLRSTATCDEIYQKASYLLSRMAEGEYAEPADIKSLLDRIWVEFLSLRTQVHDKKDPSTSTLSVLAEVTTERRYQEELYGEKKDDLNSPSTWVAIITRLLGAACSPTANSQDPVRFRTEMIKVAAVAVAAVEASDRRGEKALTLQYKKGSGV